jgi:hypothetical protein
MIGHADPVKSSNPSQQYNLKEIRTVENALAEIWRKRVNFRAQPAISAHKSAKIGRHGDQLGANRQTLPLFTYQKNA